MPKLKTITKMKHIEHNICLDGLTYLSRDFKKHCNDDTCHDIMTKIIPQRATSAFCRLYF